MYCLGCGIQLPDTARFCDECGTPQRSREERVQAPRLTTQAPRATQAPPEPVWEYCEIIWAKGGWATNAKQFHAVASGPYGSKVVEKVPAWRNSDPGMANRNAIETLVKKLTKQGWEPQPKGSEWYAHRFRRKVK